MSCSRGSRVQSEWLIREVAGEFGINPGTSGNWVKKYREDNPQSAKKMTPANYGRLAELEAANRRLRMENDFLKSLGPRYQGAGVTQKAAPI